jgi:hypothetical protein
MRRVFLNEKGTFDGLFDYSESLILDTPDLVYEEVDVTDKRINLVHCVNEPQQFLIGALLVFHGLIRYSVYCESFQCLSYLVYGS